jgi:hypothetical protein
LDVDRIVSFLYLFSYFHNEYDADTDANEYEFGAYVNLIGIWVRCFLSSEADTNMRK